MTPPRTETADAPQEEVKGETLLWRYAKRSEDDDGEEHSPGCPCCMNEQRCWALGEENA